MIQDIVIAKVQQRELIQKDRADEVARICIHDRHQEVLASMVSKFFC